MLQPGAVTTWFAAQACRPQPQSHHSLRAGCPTRGDGVRWPRMAARASDDSLTLPTARVIRVGCVLAIFLALTVSGQLYLSMISHGHSFARLFSAELARWLYWPF